MGPNGLHDDSRILPFGWQSDLEDFIASGGQVDISYGTFTIEIDGVTWYLPGFIHSNSLDQQDTNDAIKNGSGQYLAVDRIVESDRDHTSGTSSNPDNFDWNAGFGYEDIYN